VSASATHRLRLVTEDDLEEICSIVNHYIENTSFNFRLESQTVDEWREYWQHLHERFPWIAATENGRVVGMAYAAPWKERAAYQWTVETTVYVHADHHRIGVGSTLYAELLDRLRRQGFRSAIGVIGLPNDASVALHELHGFTQVARLVDAGYKLESWHDVGFWQCLLQDGGTGEPDPPSGVESW